MVAGQHQFADQIHQLVEQDYINADGTLAHRAASRLRRSVRCGRGAGLTAFGGDLDGLWFGFLVERHFCRWANVRFDRS
jgi:hypothetical protein